MTRHFQVIFKKKKTSLQSERIGLSYMWTRRNGLELHLLSGRQGDSEDFSLKAREVLQREALCSLISAP